MRGRRCVRTMSRAEHALIGRHLKAVDDALWGLIVTLAKVYGVKSRGLERAEGLRRGLLPLRLWLDRQLEREYGDFPGIGGYYFPADLPDDEQD